MQLLTAPPRDGFTAAQIMALLATEPSVQVDAGLDLLAADGGTQQAATGQPVVLDDLSDVFRRPGSSVQRNNAATVHGTCTLQLDQALAWGVDLVRPYMLLTAPRVGTARFNLGCYLATSPDQTLTFGSTYSITGYDPLVFLQVPIGATYTVAVGANVLASVQQAITAAGFAWAGVLIADQTKADAVTVNDMVWPLASGTITNYLTVINDLLASIGYRGLWADENGNYRADRYVKPADRAPEFLLVAGDTFLARSTDPDWQSKVIVSPADRRRTRDTYGVPNWWRFIQDNLPYTPVEGGGQYTVDKSPVAELSAETVGRLIRSVQYLQATSQADLVTQGDAIVTSDTTLAETIHFPTFPLPIAGHYDVATYTDPYLPDADELKQRKLQATGWNLPLDGTDMIWDWEAVA
jgi:hypothetical protein